LRGVEPPYELGLEEDTEKPKPMCGS